MEIFILILLSCLTVGVFLVTKYSTKKLSKDRKEYYKKHLKHIKTSRAGNREKIMDLDKMYHHILRDMGYNGTFGEILKTKPKKIEDLDKVWELHKLRNKIAHEFGEMDERMLGKKVEEYIWELNKLV